MQDGEGLLKDIILQLAIKYCFYIQNSFPAEKG